jgi:hypothetical protein
MGVGRLAWRTPTSAMLWEIWGRHKWMFPWHGLALAVSVWLVQWKDRGAPDVLGPPLIMIPSICFLGAYLHLLTCFGYIEVDSKRVQLGFPARLLLKPVDTIRLVLAPMLFGGGVVVLYFTIWAELVLQHRIEISATNLLWTNTVLLSFFWWMQALAWGLPMLKGRVLIDLLIAVIHLLVGLSPLLPVSALSQWQWPILVALLGSAIPAAWLGLKLMRQGRWEGPSRIFMFWSQRRSARARGPRKKFHSAFGAQLWLEWQRHGWLLPIISGVFALLVFPCFFLSLKMSDPVNAPPLEAVLCMPLFVPLVLSGVLAVALAKFDPLDSTGGLPIYMAVRPMTNGGFVMAKMAMALATSALTWLVTLVPVFFWLAVLGKGVSLSKAEEIRPYGTAALAIGCVPLLLLLVIWTWKNLVAGMGAGLTGLPWVSNLFTFGRLACAMGLVALIVAIKLNETFKESARHWGLGLLILCLAAKLMLSVLAFFLGLQRKALTALAVGCISGGWLVCGLFVAGYAGLICIGINRFDLWIWIALVGFLVLPLTDLAIAPLALAWNRHR